MNSMQRLASNTILSFIANLTIKGSDTLLFIGLGRLLGPDSAGEFTLGKTFFTLVFTLSAWGLHELLVREIAPQREKSGYYFINYLLVRISITAITYLLLLTTLNWLLPYTPETKTIIKIISLAVFPEAIFSLSQAIFIAHEQMKTPALAAIVNGGTKLALGALFMLNGAAVETIAWVIPIGSGLSIIVFIPALIRLFRQTPLHVPMRINIRFIFAQLRYTPGFIAIGIFYMLDFQTDTFLISLYLSQADVGWYGAAQTIMLGFWLLSIAVRSALYPLMARFHRDSTAKFEELYRKSMQYLMIFILPAATGITLLAQPIIVLIFKQAFIPATPALQWSIWAAVANFLAVPCVIIMLIINRQEYVARATAISMVINIGLNIWLLPAYGITGSAIARVAATSVLFLVIYRYVEKNIIKVNLWQISIRPLLALSLMSITVWLMRSLFLLWPIIAGTAVYISAAFLLGIFTEDDKKYLIQLIKPQKPLKNGKYPLN